MNKQLLIITTSAICCGFCYGAMVGSKLMEKYYDDISTKEIEKAREYYHELTNMNLKDISEKMKDEGSSNKEIAEKLDISESPVRELINLYKPNTVFDPDPFSDILDEEEEETDGAVIEVESSYLEDSTTPYVITEEEFSSECLHYDKVSAIYFADGTLTDEDEQIIDIASTIGFGALDEFATDDDDKPVYVRNESLGVDYMVMQNKLSYSSYILGVDEDDDVRDSKKRSKGEWTE